MCAAVSSLAEIAFFASASRASASVKLGGVGLHHSTTLGTTKKWSSVRGAFFIRSSA